MIRNKNIPPSTNLPQIPDDPRLRMIKRVSKLMDEQFSIGGIKFGLDPLLNFIPFAGDIGSYIISVFLILTMFQYGASGRLVVKMLGNATLDALISSVPVIGWIFDFTYKANTKNVRLLTEHYVQGKHRGSATPILVSIVVILCIVVVVICIIIYKVFQWMGDLFNTPIPGIST